MKHNPDIQKELELLAPALAKIERKNPFKIPDNYFDNQAATITAACKGEEPALSNELSALKSQEIFKVPEGYFGQLSGRIVSAVQNSEQDEVHLKQQTGTFSVPQGYFSGLPTKMLEKAKEAEAAGIVEEHLRPITAKNPFTVPQGYFEQLPQAILETVKASENEQATQQIVEQTIRPITAKNPMTVPQGYFAQLPQAMLETVKAGVKAVENEEAIQQIVEQQLRPITAKNPMTVPQGYFKQMPQAMLEMVKEAEAAQIVEETIRPMDNADAFKTPDTYFEEVPQRVSDKVGTEQGGRPVELDQSKGGRVIEMEPAAPRKAKTVPMWRRATAVAATLLMFAVGSWFVFGPGGQSGGNNPGFAVNPTDSGIVQPLADNDKRATEKLAASLANLSDVELNALIQAEGIDEIDESQLMDGLKSEDVFKIDNINTDAIQQYLLEELDEDLLKDLI